MMSDSVQAAVISIDSRQQLLARLKWARAQTDELFQLVRPEALYDRPIPERHRLIFYRGHLETFDWNLLGRQIFGLDCFHPGFDKLFAFGIDPVDRGLPSDQPSDWPQRAEIDRYNGRIRKSLDAVLEKVSFADPDQPLLRQGLVLHVAIEHRLMHAETLAYMLHQLPLERKFAPPAALAPAAVRPAHKMIRIPAATATLGRRRTAADDFGWDNEFEANQRFVPAFEIDAYNVTNGQFLDFLRAGGYQEPELWSASDWEWKSKRGVNQPQFWRRRGEAWFLQGMFEELPLPLDWPVYVSHAEATAYLRSVGKTLPTEEQFHRAAYGTPAGREREFPWGEELPNRRYGNFDFQRWNPTPVGAYPDGHSAFGIADLVGNGWEWTSSIFEPFAGFQAFPFYPGYSTDFFDGRHFVVKGGSSRTAACLLRRSFRNWFQPHYPYVYATFRGVQNNS
jgi:iron(II)-dependent oxidoreductase